MSESSKPRLSAPEEPLLQREVLTEQANAEMNVDSPEESKLSLSGVKGAITKFRISRIEHTLDSVSEPKNLPPRTVSKNSARLDENGRRSLINSDMIALHKPERDSENNIDSSTIVDRKARRKFEKNARKIKRTAERIVGSEAYREKLEDKKAILEQKIEGKASLASHEDVADASKHNSIETFSNPTRDVLKGQSRTEKAMAAALIKLTENRKTIIDESLLGNLLDGIEDATPALIKFTLNKLKTLGIVDNDGRIIASKDKLQEQLDILSSPNHEGITKLDQSGFIEHTPGSLLNNDQLEAAAKLILQAQTSYLSATGAQLDSDQNVKDLNAIEDGVIRSFIGPETSYQDVASVKADILGLFERRAKLKTSSETPAERKARIAEQKAQALQKAEDAEAAEWAWAGKEKRAPVIRPGDEVPRRLETVEENAQRTFLERQ